MTTAAFKLKFLFDPVPTAPGSDAVSEEMSL